MAWAIENAPNTIASLEQATGYEAAEAVFTGGGVQVLYRLVTAIEVGDDPQQPAGYNKALQDLVGSGSDDTHNIDRIFRLPGTVNWPGEVKAARGRVPAPAFVLGSSEAIVNNGALRWSDPGAARCAAPTVAVPSDLPTIDTWDQFAAHLPPELDANSDNVARLRIVFENGFLAASPKEGDEVDAHGEVTKPDRSTWAADFACNARRAGCDNNTILAALLGASAIAAHCRDHAKPEYAASRCIGYADEQHVTRGEWLTASGGSELDELNEHHAIIAQVGGKFRVLNEFVDPQTGLDTFTFSTKTDFCNAYAHRWVPVGDNKFKPLGEWWVKHPSARRYRTVTFVPEGDAGPDYNLWRGFSVTPREGDCSLFLDHLLNVVCNYRQDDYNYLLDWMARCVQDPGRPGEVAVVLRGDKGTGKSLPISLFGSLFGPHFMAVSKADHLTGKFNGHLATCVVLFADEAFYAGNRAHEATLKTLITERHTMLERKGIDAQPMRNYLHIFMASNNAWVVPASVDERRFFVLDVTDERRGDFDYFKALVAQMNAGGREALLHFLLDRDISAFNVRNVPQTDALEQQRLRTQLGQDPAAEAVFDMLWTGEPPECAEYIDGKVWIPSRDWACAIGCSGRSMGLQLKATDARRHQETNGYRRKGWLMSSLPVAREAWNSSVTWPTGDSFDWMEDHDAF